MALVNALYLRANWEHEFNKESTWPAPFHLAKSNATPVPTMHSLRSFGYAKRENHTAVTIPYLAGTLQFVLLVPDSVDGLPALERSLTERELSECATLKKRQVRLYLPKFKIATDTLALKPSLKALGMRTAFDDPPGSANFDQMAPRTPDDYLAISEVFHKTWLTLDEQGTEAAAATAVLMVRVGGVPKTPIEVRADRPFMFAIQHVTSGACLFLGRVTDPR